MMVVPGTVFVATLDTGGISYSGREYVAVAASASEARRAIYDAWRNGRRAVDRLGINSIAMLDDEYGIRVYEVPVGRGVEVNT